MKIKPWIPRAEARGGKSFLDRNLWYNILHESATNKPCSLYDTKYHLVWAPKYRKWILRGDIQQTVKNIFEEIATNHDFEIDMLEVAKDHVHVFLSFPPRYSISRVVEILKSISASVIFAKHPEVKKELWGGEFWEDGYFARTTGDKVTQEIIRNYLKYHRTKEKSPAQSELF